jgi:hypothetical protein
MQQKSFSVLTVSKRAGWPLGPVQIQTALRGNGYGEWIKIIEGINAPEKTRASNLNKSLNAGLNKIRTDYVIFYQDFIELEPDCFERLLELADENTFVTTCTKNPDGKHEDPRYLGADCPRPCTPDEWEANVAIAPMKAIRELGGFDEEYDDGWSWDNVNLAERAAILGYRFVLDESNRPQLLPHPPAHDGELEPNGERHSMIMKEIRDGKRPIKCDYVV